MTPFYAVCFGAVVIGAIAIVQNHSIRWHNKILHAITSTAPDSDFDAECVKWREIVNRAIEHSFGITLTPHIRRIGRSGIVGRLYCDCGVSQTLALRDVPGGVTLREARAIGWQITDEAALCPVCSGALVV